MIADNKINKRSMALVLGLSEYSQRDAISILAAAISIITSQPEQNGDRLDEPCMAFKSGLLRRHPGNPSRIEKDSEVQAFILNLDQYYVTSDLLAMIEKRFGKERTPSKSGLGRYLQKITKSLTPNKGGNNHE